VRRFLPVLFLLLLLSASAGAAGDRRDRGAGPPAPRETVEKVLEVLDRPEFRGSDQEEEGLLLILSNLLSDLVDYLKRLRESRRGLYWTVVGWLAATLLVIVGHVAWTVWKGSGPGAGGPAGSRALLDPALATRAGRDPDRMLARADAAAAARPAEGIPWLYLALLFRLERAGRLEFDAARTGLEYADDLARRPGDRLLWREFLDAHDPVVFGAKECPREAYDALRRRALAPLPEVPPAGPDR
jgi:hypothetical protein